jgi:hypothetical protein
VTERDQAMCQPVRPGARFEGDIQRFAGLLFEEPQQLRPRELSPEDNRVAGAESDDVERAFADVDADLSDGHAGDPPLGVNLQVSAD